MKFIGSTLILGFLTLLSGCLCKAVPSISHLDFVLLNESGTNLVDSLYTTLNYELTDATGQTYYAERKQGDATALLRISYENLTSGADYYLRFSGSDSDTVSIKYTSEEGRCQLEYSLVEFKYNGEIYPLVSEGAVFQVQK